MGRPAVCFRIADAIKKACWPSWAAAQQTNNPSGLEDCTNFGSSREASAPRDDQSLCLPVATKLGWCIRHSDHDPGFSGNRLDHTVTSTTCTHTRYNIIAATYSAAKAGRNPSCSPIGHSGSHTDLDHQAAALDSAHGEQARAEVGPETKPRCWRARSHGLW